ncbi:hypothetical protein PsYK624_126230 [Phanerochaete sordida]|uniref:Mid2 domain-containing protein n=1 Tax=Phanerochaete sordida TaxID=48140 RepID=A0A9P3GK26_9APHY|nr:hypothetical protein PsYK624_126230 [Phanerochaete sordida]
MSLPFLRLAPALCCLALFSPALAQIPTTFRWSFGGSTQPQQSLQECQKYQITIQSQDGGSSSQAGVPPYYMLALEPSGIPTTSLIGSDPSNLWWQANHQNGRQLMLAVVDSKNNTGGVAQSMYTVTAGSDTSCLSNIPSSGAAIQPNVSTTLNTCDAWGLTLSGGKTPYTVVIAQVQSNTLTVVTMDKDNDLLTYVNRGTPGAPIMAAIYDATGEWGTSTPALQTKGQIQQDCGGMETEQGSTDSTNETPISVATIVRAIPTGTSVGPPSSSSSTPASHQTQQPANLSQGSHVSTGLIAGVALGVGIPVLFGVAGLIGWYCIRRRRRRDAAVYSSRPDMFQAPHSPAVGYIDGVAATPFAPNRHSSSHYRSTTPTMSSDVGTSDAGPARAGYATSGGSSALSAQSAQSEKMRRMQERRAEPEEVVVQHQDSGVVITELPPPYIGGS